MRWTASARHPLDQHHQQCRCSSPSHTALDATTAKQTTNSSLLAAFQFQHTTLHQQSLLKNAAQPVLSLSTLLLTPHKLLVTSHRWWTCSPYHRIGTLIYHMQHCLIFALAEIVPIEFLMQSKFLYLNPMVSAIWNRLLDSKLHHFFAMILAYQPAVQ
jgi:hypothetical protein